MLWHAWSTHNQGPFPAAFRPIILVMSRKKQLVFFVTCQVFGLHMHTCACWLIQSPRDAPASEAHGMGSPVRMCLTSFWVCPSMIDWAGNVGKEEVWDGTEKKVIYGTKNQWKHSKADRIILTSCSWGWTHRRKLTTSPAWGRGQAQVDVPLARVEQIRGDKPDDLCDLDPCCRGRNIYQQVWA